MRLAAREARPFPALTLGAVNLRDTMARKSWLLAFLARYS